MFRENKYLRYLSFTALILFGFLLATLPHWRELRLTAAIPTDSAVVENNVAKRFLRSKWRDPTVDPVTGNRQNQDPMVPKIAVCCQ